MKNILKHIWRFAGPISVIASILSFFALFFAIKTAAYVALVFFILALLFIVYKLSTILSRIVETTYVDNFANHSMFIRYSTADKYKISYEVFKHVQCKRLSELEYPYKFKWSGSKTPTIISNIQTVGDLQGNTQEGFDTVILKFKEPLYYNDTTVVHFKAELDDSDLSSATHLDVKITHKTSVIYFNVELLYKAAHKTKAAILERKKIESSISRDYEQIDTVPFIGKSYSYHLFNPEIGYYYRLKWDR